MSNQTTPAKSQTTLKEIAHLRTRLAEIREILDGLEKHHLEVKPADLNDADLIFDELEQSLGMTLDEIDPDYFA